MSSKPSATPTAIRTGAWSAICVAAGMAVTSGAAHAQSASSTLSSYRTGYGGTGLSGLESPVNLSLISAASQYTISDGVNQAGAVGSVFAAQSSSGETSGGGTSGGVGQVATNNQRAPVAVADSMTLNVVGAHEAAGAPNTTTSPTGATTGATTGAPTGATVQTTTPNEMVLNGKINLDGGQ